MLTSLTAIAQDTNRTNPVNPDDPCGQYRDDINDCFYENSVTTSACAACDYTGESPCCYKNTRLVHVLCDKF